MDTRLIERGRLVPIGRRWSEVSLQTLGGSLGSNKAAPNVFLYPLSSCRGGFMLHIHNHKSSIVIHMLENTKSRGRKKELSISFAWGKSSMFLGIFYIEASVAEEIFGFWNSVPKIIRQRDHSQFTALNCTSPFPMRFRVTKWPTNTLHSDYCFFF